MEGVPRSMKQHGGRVSKTRVPSVGRALAERGLREKAMRIIAGTARGQRLLTPAGDKTRPTSDRVRETLFNVLGQWCDDEDVLDLYAGSGSLGLEALSRGARHATFVESAREAFAVLEENVRALRFQPRATCVRSTVERALEHALARGESYSLVLSDAPYELKSSARVLGALDRGVLRPGGRAVIEHDRRETPLREVGALRCVDVRRFGDTVLSLYAHA